MVGATDLIGIVVLLFIAVVALLVLFFDALCRVLVGAVAALARAPWRSIQRRSRDQPFRRRFRLQRRSARPELPDHSRSGSGRSLGSGRGVKLTGLGVMGQSGGCERSHWY
jgi:hypothetical protein